jgi:competence protein ComEA
MPTPAEQKALAFISLVVLLGGAVRVVRGGALAHPASAPSSAEQQALARQAYAANSTAVAVADRKGARKGASKHGAPKRRYAGAKLDSTGLLVEGTGVASTTLGSNGFPPPGPRIDVGVRPAEVAAGVPLVGQMALPTVVAVDLDIADTVQIGRLPRVGPALARRIVANRDSLGPFGSLSGLRRVRGIGPATLKRLGGLVTFSGQARR